MPRETADQLVRRVLLERIAELRSTELTEKNNVLIDRIFPSGLEGETEKSLRQLFNLIYRTLIEHDKERESGRE